MNPRPRPSIIVCALAACVALLVAGCGSSGGTTAGGSQTSALPAGITVAKATIDWPANPSTAAVRMVVRNGGATADALVSVSSPVAAHATIHRSTTDAAGRSTMVLQRRLSIPARSSVTFAPDGLHVMLTGITADLAVGDRVQLSLEFEHAGTVRATATVVEPGTAANEESHDH